MKKEWKRYTTAHLRDVWVLAREFRTSLFMFMVVLLAGATIFHLLYASPETGQGISYVEALHVVFKLIVFETILPFPDHWLLQILFFVVPILGLVVIVSGMVNFGVMLFNKQARREEWQVAIASTYSGHIVVCGLGKVGYRVIQQLLKFDEEVIGVEQNGEARFVERIRQQRIPVIIDDARKVETLIKAGVERANSIICCTQDDLTNLDIALDARNLNPHIKVVMRMFDAELAKKIEKGFGIHTAFSTSALAAPAFAAAATRATITNAFYIDDILLNVSEVTVKAGSRLVGKSIEALEAELELSIILYKGQDKLDLHPKPHICLRGDDKIVVFASLDVLNRLAQLNQVMKL
jgi:voltage-gated potassium channel